MSEKNQESTPNITLDNATYPRAFLSLASAVLASLQEEGVCLLRVNESGTVERISKDMLTWFTPPMLLVDPSYIVKHDEEKQQITVDIHGCSLLRSMVLAEEQHDAEDE